MLCWCFPRVEPCLISGVESWPEEGSGGPRACACVYVCVRVCLYVDVDVDVDVCVDVDVDVDVYVCVYVCIISAAE